MMVEGKGLVAPRPETVNLTQADLDWLERIAAEREHRRGYATRRDTWGRGIVNSPTFVGLVGEFAVASYLAGKLGTNVPINTEDAPTGDGGVDLVAVGTPIQVKTRLHRADLLIRRETEKGRLLTIRWNWCVSVTWNREAAPLSPTLDGCMRRFDLIEHSRFVLGRRGDWKNLEVEDCQLEPLSTLVYALEVNRQWGGLP